MIAGYSCKPVFQYQFRPLSDQGHRAADGGFCVILYENRILSFSTYDVSNRCLDELCFSLTEKVMRCFFSLLRVASSWLASSPVDLRASNLSPYASSFAFDGYDPIRIWGMNELICEPACSELGFFARHVYVLFEDIANLLAEIGIRLTLDGFTWDNQSITPFRKNQMYHSGQLGVV